MDTPVVRMRRVYDPTEPDDGLRVLVTTYWPRGVSRQAISRWERTLGVPVAILRLWLDGHLSPADFAAQYRHYLSTSTEAQAAMRSLLLDHPVCITLLTSLKDMQRSHLPFLRDALLEMANSDAPSGTAPAP